MNKTCELKNLNSVRPFVKEVLKYKKSGSVLDLGPAAGRHSLFFAKKGFKVTSVEKSTEFYAALKELARIQKLPIKLIMSDVTLYKPTQKFDVIISTMVLHFLSEKEQYKQIKMMQDNTKKDGVNVISSYNGKNKIGLRPHMLPPEKIKELYEKAGWKILYSFNGKGQPYIDNKSKGKKIGFWKEELIAQKTQS